MNKMTKTMMTGAIAASLLFAGAGYLQSYAHAATDTLSTKAKPFGKEVRFGKGHRDGFFGIRGGSLLKETSGILGVDESNIKSGLEGGQTLAQIAEGKGVTTTDLVNKLTAEHQAKLDEQVTSGKITQEQADKRKQELTEMVTKVVNSSFSPSGKREMKGLGKGRGDVQFKGQGFGGVGGFSKVEDMAEIIGVTSDELKNAMKEGKSLVEIAQSKGIEEAELIEKIKEKMTDPIKAWVNHKRSTEQTGK
jgi:uncharacterized protein YidB (DUF937 family)